MTAQRAFRSDRILLLALHGEAESSRKAFASFVNTKEGVGSWSLGTYNQSFYSYFSSRRKVTKDSRRNCIHSGQHPARNTVAVEHLSGGQNY